MKKFLLVFMLIALTVSLNAQNFKEDDYTEIKSWDAVKLDFDRWLDKKVAVRTMFTGINNSDLGDGRRAYVSLLGISTFCDFDSTVVEALLELDMRWYYFYGTVIKDRNGSPVLRIEGIR